MVHKPQNYINPVRLHHKKQLIFLNSLKTNRFQICYRREPRAKNQDFRVVDVWHTDSFLNIDIL